MWETLTAAKLSARQVSGGSSKLSPWGVFGEKDILRLFSRTQTLEIVERIRTDTVKMLTFQTCCTQMEICQMHFHYWKYTSLFGMPGHSAELCLTLSAKCLKVLDTAGLEKSRTIQGSIVFVKTALVGNFNGGRKP